MADVTKGMLYALAPDLQARIECVDDAMQATVRDLRALRLAPDAAAFMAAHTLTHPVPAT